MKTLKFKNTILLNNRGAALIFSYLVLSVLLTLSAGFALMTLNELRQAQRYRYSTAAFWLAESGINQFLQDTTMLDVNGLKVEDTGSTHLEITKDDSDPAVRLVNSVATVNGVIRLLQVKFPAELPEVYSNTVSTTKDIMVFGTNVQSKFDFNGKTRMSGQFLGEGNPGGDPSLIYFEDKQDGASTDVTYLGYPDRNGNGIPNEKGDFIQFNRDLISSLPPNDVLYIQDNSVWLDLSGADFSGKKVVYIEGPFMVSLEFNGGVSANQNLTIITDGAMFYNNADTPNNSRLDLISWNGFSQMNGLLPVHKHTGIVFSNWISWLYSDGINGSSQHVGNFIVTDGAFPTGALPSIMEQWDGGTTSFSYQTPLVNGNLPFGFDGLVGMSSQSGYSSIPSGWREL